MSFESLNFILNENVIVIINPTFDFLFVAHCLTSKILIKGGLFYANETLCTINTKLKALKICTLKIRHNTSVITVKCVNTPRDHFNRPL